VRAPWRYFTGLLRTAGSALAGTALLLAGVLILNWGFLALQVVQLGSAMEARVGSIAGAALSGTALVAVFGVVIPLAYLPLLKSYGTRLTARRLYDLHRDAVDHAILEFSRRGQAVLPTAGATAAAGATDRADALPGVDMAAPETATMAAAAGRGQRMQANAAAFAAYLRSLPKPVAIVVRHALGRSSFEGLVARLEAVHADDSPAGTTASIALDAVHMQIERVLDTGPPRALKLMAAANVLLVAVVALL
jgi:hypothetical protein